MDSLEYLFNAYQLVTNKHFHWYIEMKENEYEDGENFTYQELMTSSLNKYKVQKEKGLWNVPTEEQTKIIALQSQLNQLKKKRNKSQGKKNSDSGINNNTTKKKEKPDWYSIKPTGNQP